MDLSRQTCLLRQIIVPIPILVVTLQIFAFNQGCSCRRRHFDLFHYLWDECLVENRFEHFPRHARTYVPRHRFDCLGELLPRLLWSKQFAFEFDALSMKLRIHHKLIPERQRWDSISHWFCCDPYSSLPIFCHTLSTYSHLRWLFYKGHALVVCLYWACQTCFLPNSTVQLRRLSRRPSFHKRWVWKCIESRCQRVVYFTLP